MIYIVDRYRGDAMKVKKARVFWTGRSQAIRLPKEFRFATDTVLVHRQGQAVVVEPADEWPEGYVESFAGVPHDFTRPSQGKVEKRTSLG
jgi:antitoxin VapB